MRALGRLSGRPALAFRVMEEVEAEVADTHSGAVHGLFFGTFHSSSGGVDAGGGDAGVGVSVWVSGVGILSEEQQRRWTRIPGVFVTSFLRVPLVVQ
jgi:hypothetical protein